MWLLLIRNWKILTAASLFISGLYLGHYLTHQAWQAEVNAQISANEKAAKAGETKLITEIPKLVKVIHASSDKCATTALPADIAEQLRN